MKRIGILGSGAALKPKIIIETLAKMNISTDKEFVCFTDSKSGAFYEYCKSIGMETLVFENDKLNDISSIEIARNANVDILVSAGWPHKVPVEFLKLFNNVPINCHGSILPDYRGSRAYMHYWANCEEFYGATIHFMNDKFDDGNILVQGRLKSYPEETPTIIHRRIAELCGFLLPIAFTLLETGCSGKRQEGVKRYFKKLEIKEFEEYRKYNENHSIQDRKSTPYIVL